MRNEVFGSQDHTQSRVVSADWDGAVLSKGLDSVGWAKD